MKVGDLVRYSEEALGGAKDEGIAVVIEIIGDLALCAWFDDCIPCLLREGIKSLEVINESR